VIAYRATLDVPRELAWFVAKLLLAERRRNALPVLRDLRDNLDGQPISVVLTDARGVLLTRLTPDRDLERHLDGVQLLPGFCYAEQFVGTNGIGTALESGQAAHVFGHEHYAEHVEDLACAAAPVRHPLSGKIAGVVGLTCWRKDADALLIALAESTAGQIAQALLDDASGWEVRLLQEYLRACRHSAGIVFALNEDMVMMSHHARDVLDPGDQAAVLGQAAEALAAGRRGLVDVQLPSGARARLSCRPVRGKGQRGLAGGVAHATLAAGAGPRPRGFLPGLAGCGPLWARGCDQVDAAYCGGEWLAVAGEPGTGKLALLRAVHRRRNPAGALHVLDAADAAGHQWLVRALGELLEGKGSLVIRHVDLLSPVQARTLGIALEQALAAGRQTMLWVAVTLSQSPARAGPASLLRFFPGTVQLPPLRHHIEDIHQLVPFFLAKLNHDGQLTCSPAAIQLLQRSSWPRNTGQLWQVLRRVMRLKRSGTIDPGDLPPECWTVTRRLLHPLEAMERDAIVQALLDYHGNKAKTAQALGMSRATIYRKIHQYGIATPAS
jgi:transcriptional regulator of acetoin/glycerol metabolism